MTTPAHPSPPEHPGPAGSEDQSPHPFNDEDVAWADITAQAAHLRRLADHLDQLTGEVSDLRQRADQLDTVAADIHHTLQQHRAQELAGPPNWATMDTEHATQAWEDLAQWIDQTFVPWYDITRDQLPDCWALHRPAVTELSWLHHTHNAAHQPGAPAHLIADWHTHWKPAALTHIHSAIPRHGLRACSPGHHHAASTHRAPHTSPQPPIKIAPAQAVPARQPGEQLAYREHWHDYYCKAMARDLANRSAHGEEHMP